MRKISEKEKDSTMHSSSFIVLVLVFLLSFSFFGSIASQMAEGESTVDWKLSIPGEPVRYNGTHAIMVTGIEHNLTFYIGQSENVTVSLTYSVLSKNDEHNNTNTYLWTYRGSSFSDVLYGTYINQTSSSLFSDKIAFHIGIHAKAKEGIWILRVNRTIASRIDTIISEEISVEKADPHLGLSTPEFEFRVEPFESGKQISPSFKEYKFTTINSGNVPLWLSCSYDKMGEIFNTTNMSTVLHPGERIEHHIFLVSMPWSPQVFTVKEHVKGTSMHIITSDMVSFIPSFQTVVKINVKVVRQGFNILDIGPAKLQYEKGPKVAEFDDVMDLRLFLSGDSDASLTVSVDKLELVGLYYDEKWINNTESDTSKTLRFHLDNVSDEKEIMIKVHCIREKVTGSVSYHLSSGGDSNTTKTEIVVGSAPYVPQTSDKNHEMNIMALAGVLAVIAVIVFFMIYYTKKLKEEEY